MLSRASVHFLSRRPSLDKSCNPPALLANCSRWIDVWLERRKRSREPENFPGLHPSESTDRRAPMCPIFFFLERPVLGRSTSTSSSSGLIAIIHLGEHPDFRTSPFGSMLHPNGPPSEVDLNKGDSPFAKRRVFLLLLFLSSLRRERIDVWSLQLCYRQLIFPRALPSLNGFRSLPWSGFFVEFWRAEEGRDPARSQGPGGLGWVGQAIIRVVGLKVWRP